MIPTTIYSFQSGVETRWANAENPKGEKGAGAQANNGRKGSAAIKWLKHGDQYVLAEAVGRSGMIRRIWVTTSDRSPQMLRGLRLDIYWDNAPEPAISAPLGDFFGTSAGLMVPFQSALFSSPEGRSLNCYVPMPFRTGMRLVVVNESGRDLHHLFYEVNYTINDIHDDNTLYFHAHFRRERPTTLKRDYEILPTISGRGKYLGANMGVLVNRKCYGNTWWGEGEVKAYIDGDSTYPTLTGTGTEDYIGTGWSQGRFDHLYQGCPVANHEQGHYSFYRYHIPDPVFFAQSIRVTVQQIGHVGPGNADLVRELGNDFLAAGADDHKLNVDEGGLFERHDDWSSCVYFYLDKPMNGLPGCIGAEERLLQLPERA